MGKIKLGIVDDNKDFCEALQDFFSCQQDMEVVFSAEDGIPVSYTHLVCRMGGIYE